MRSGYFVPKFQALAPPRELVLRDTELSVNLFINLRFADGHIPDEEELKALALRAAPVLRRYWPDILGVEAAHSAEENEVSLLVELPVQSNMSLRDEAAVCCCRALAGSSVADGLSGNA